MNSRMTILAQFGASFSLFSVVADSRVTVQQQPNGKQTILLFSCHENNYSVFVVVGNAVR